MPIRLTIDLCSSDIVKISRKGGAELVAAAERPVVTGGVAQAASCSNYVFYVAEATKPDLSNCTFTPVLTNSFERADNVLVRESLTSSLINSEDNIV
jgi:hypothetical protein